MNFREVSATILAALVIAVALSAAMGPPPREGYVSMVARHDLEHRSAP
jgi:hypothetical protein